MLYIREYIIYIIDRTEKYFILHLNKEVGCEIARGCCDHKSREARVFTPLEDLHREKGLPI